MREDICTIPIHEVFEPKDGCPLCRMRDMLEDRMATYITGAAMMEPDVRMETNRLGFCESHFRQILMRGSRLSVALILESLLHEMDEEIFEGAKPDPKSAAKKVVPTIEKREKSCFICENIEKNMDHLNSTVVTMWQKDEEFRQLFAQQPYICLPHCRTLLRATQKLPKKEATALNEVILSLSRQYLQEVNADVTHFCRMFDYRNNGGDWGNSRDSIERSIRYITSRDPQVTAKADEKNR